MSLIAASVPLHICASTLPVNNRYATIVESTCANFSGLHQEVIKMSRSLKVAAVQMDVAPASVSDRLERAYSLIRDAVSQGAELVVLPEVFNTGYAYTDANYENAERFDGPTIQWMKGTAAEFNIHLAGSLLLWNQEHSDIVNTLVLFDPRGRSWSYDKNYPWSWERAYFVPAKKHSQTVVAHTDLGDIGFLVCWDIAHAHLWKQYAGKVDMMVICSCPPDAFKAELKLPSVQLGPKDMGSTIQSMHDEAYNLFGRTLEQQCAWLGVPGISAICNGTLSTPIPKGKGAFLVYILSSLKLAKYMGEANDLEMTCQMYSACKVIGADGSALAFETGSDEKAVVAEISLPNQKPRPVARQPKPIVRKTSYLLADFWFPLLTRSLYVRKVKQPLLK